jgi:hypothetical protein
LLCFLEARLGDMIGRLMIKRGLYWRKVVRFDKGWVFIRNEHLPNAFSVIRFLIFLFRWVVCIFCIWLIQLVNSNRSRLGIMVYGWMVLIWMSVSFSLLCLYWGEGGFMLIGK